MKSVVRLCTVVVPSSKLSMEEQRVLQSLERLDDQLKGLALVLYVTIDILAINPDFAAKNLENPHVVTVLLVGSNAVLVLLLWSLQRL